jgi:hypothetical protein
LRDPRSRHAIEVAEAYVDEQAKLKDAQIGARAACEEIGERRDTSISFAESFAADAVREVVGTFPIGAANWGSSNVCGAVTYLPDKYPGGRKAEETAHAVLLRDIFGNPFRPVTFSTSWQTDTAVSLARQMYDSRDFSAMPILADALQDAGCDNDDILNHCRGAGSHVRGCWVVDLVLGKE